MTVSGNVGGKFPVVDIVLASQEQEIHPNISLDENCIEFEFQMDPNYYVNFRQTYSVLRLKFVSCRGYENYTIKEVKKKHQEEKKAVEEKAEEQEDPVLLVNWINNNLHSFFPILNGSSTFCKNTMQMVLMRTSITFTTTSRELSLNTSEG